MSAVISPCGQYRYALSRDLGQLGAEGTVLFVMLNPSTADATQNDPTVRRCIGFAQRWGYARLTVANLYGLRATDPTALYPSDSAIDPVGPDNDEWILRLAHDALEVVAAWGAHRHATPERVERVLEIVERDAGHSMRCLGQTKTLAPRHPLYLATDTRREPFKRLARSFR